MKPTELNVTSFSEMRDLSSGAHRLLVGLLTYRNRETGRCNPAIRKLRDRLGGVPRRTIFRWLAELRSKGIVEVKKSPGSSNFYVFHGCGKLLLKSCENANEGSAKNGTGGSAKNGTPSYMNLTVIEPTGGADAPLVSPPVVHDADFRPPERKPPGRETAVPVKHEHQDFPLIRDSLRELAAQIHWEPPDDDLVRQVAAAAPGATGAQIHATLCGLYKRDRLRNMRSWGLIPALIRACYNTAKEA